MKTKIKIKLSVHPLENEPGQGHKMGDRKRSHKRYFSFCFWAITRSTPVFRDLSRWFLGDHMGCHRSNSFWSHGKQSFYLLSLTKDFIK